MDKAHLGGGLLALDASPRPLGFLNLLSPPTSSPPFHRTRTMEADDVPAVPGNKGRRSIEVDFFSDDKDKKSAAAAANDKKEDLTTINVRYLFVLITCFISSLDLFLFFILKKERTNCSIRSVHPRPAAPLVILC
jgi:hypothetical protein